MYWVMLEFYCVCIAGVYCLYGND